MSGPEYRVNKTTGQVIKDDGTGWKPVASVRSKTTGEILIDEGNGWQPMPGSSASAKPNPAMTLASQRANQAVGSGQLIAKDDLAQLGRPDFSGAAMSRLPAPTMRPEELDAFDAQRAAEKERLRVPDSNFKERLVIGSNIGTLGHGPQAMAGASTVGALLATPFVEGDIIDREGVSGAMSSFLNDARVHQGRARAERPIESYGIEIGGSLLQGKTFIDNFGRKVLPKTNTLSNVGRVVGTGTGYGALYSFGQSESDTLQGALGDAAFGGALGGAGGLVVKAAEPAVTAGYRTAKTGAATISDTLSSLLGKAGGARDKVAGEVAIAAVRRSADRSGLTIDQMMELVKRYEGKPAVLAEILGQDAINALTALTRRPGTTPQKAQAIIEERAFARPERMKGDVEDATGIQIGQLDQTLQAQLAERQAAAKPIYDALYKQFNTIESFRQPGQTGQVQKRLNRLGRTPLAQRHLQLAKDAVATAAGRRGIAISKMSKMEYWDQVKRSIDDAINSAKAKGEDRTRIGEGIEDLVGLKDDLVTELDRLTGGAYAAAREAGGEAPRLRAAAQAGQKALQARNPREVAKTVAATLSQDLPALRAGIVDDLGTRIDKGMTPGRVRVPDVAGKLRSGLGEESANKLINRLDAEATLSETGARWAPRMNSVTGTIMESGATQMGDDLINAGFSLATGNQMDLLRKAINFMRQRGFSQRQIDAIGDLLLSSPEEGLKRLKLLTPDGAPVNAFAPAAGAADGALNSTAQGGTPAANAFAQKPGKLGTRIADGAAIATLAAGGPTAEADTGTDAQARIAELSQSQASAQQQIKDYEQALKAFEAMPPKEKQAFLKNNGYRGPNGETINPDGDVRGITGFAIDAYKTELNGALAAQKAERDKSKKEINKIRVALAQKPEKQTNPLVDKLTEYGTYAAVAYGAHRFRGAMIKGSQVTANRAAAKANALLTRLPVPPEPPRQTLYSRVPGLGDKQKARIRRETNAANKAQFATEERLAGRNIPPISSTPTSPDGLPNRLANVDEFDRQRAAGNFGPVSRIGRFMEPVNSRFKGTDIFVIGTGAADAYITEGMIKKTRADIAAEEARLEEAKNSNEGEGDPDAIELSTKRLEQLRQAETVQVVLQRVGIGMMIGGFGGLTHGRYARPQPRFEAAARERDLINRAMAPPPPPANAFAPPSTPKKPRTVGTPKQKPKPPVSFSGGRSRKAENDNDR